jgi:hypothetical protein
MYKMKTYSVTSLFQKIAQICVSSTLFYLGHIWIRSDLDEQDSCDSPFKITRTNQDCLLLVTITSRPENLRDSKSASTSAFAKDTHTDTEILNVGFS